MSNTARHSPATTRFAPSPTGRLHLGHAYAALFAWRAAQTSGGRFLLRIEDIDIGRCRPQFEAAILEDLAWLGEGLPGWEWPAPVRRQSDHMADYRRALDRLEAIGLLYPCFCTRKRIQAEIAAAASAPHGPDGPLYPGICKGLSETERRDRIAAGEPYALRLDGRKTAAQAGPLTWREIGEPPHLADPGLFGDPVLARKDIAASYHLCCVVDDHLQGVNLVTRGLDLKPATHLHRLLQALLGFAAPSYRHHRLITDNEGQRLAKRDDAASLHVLRAAGGTPADIRALIGQIGSGAPPLP